MKKFFHFAFFALIAFLALPTCSLKIDPTLTIKLEMPRARSARVPDIKSLSLYFLVIRGQPDTLTNAQVGNRSLSCLGWKGLIISGTYDQVAGGLSATVPAGTYRMQFYGVSGTGTSFPEIFSAPGTPEMYALTSEFEVNTASQTTTSVRATYPGVAVDLAPSCQPITGGQPIVAAFKGGAGTPYSTDVTYENPLNYPPRDIDNNPKTSVNPLDVLFLTGASPGQHLALDFFIDLPPPGRALLGDITIRFSGTQGSSTYANGTCSGYFPSGQSYSMAIYNNFANAWAEVVARPDAGFYVGDLQNIVISQYTFNGQVAGSIRTAAQAGLNTCAYLDLTSLTFDVVYN